MNKEWITVEFMQKLVESTKVTEECIIYNAKFLLKLCQNFDTVHQGLNNLKDVQFKSLSKFI